MYIITTEKNNGHFKSGNAESFQQTKLYDSIVPLLHIYGKHTYWLYKDSINSALPANENLKSQKTILSHMFAY